MALNPTEKHLAQCLEELFQYCKTHKECCDGCIFYQKVSTLGISIGICKVMDAPEFFGYSHDTDDQA